jgi:hypothetical protein
MYFDFLYKILSEKFLILRKIQRDIILNVHISVFMWTTLCSCQILSKLEFFKHIFEIYLHIKFPENLSSVSWVVPCGQTERQTDMTKLKVAFRIMTQIEKEGSVRSPIIITNLKFCGSTKLLQSNTMIVSRSRFQPNTSYVQVRSLSNWNCLLH